MADEKKVISAKETEAAEVVAEEVAEELDAAPAEEKAKVASVKKKKNAAKNPNFFVRIWKKLCKLCKDVAGEMKKVVWTPKDELKKNTKLVLVTVLAIAASIAVVDTLFSWIINTIAGLIG